MKFKDLKIGARFKFVDDAYQKTGHRAAESLLSHFMEDVDPDADVIEAFTDLEKLIVLFGARGVKFEEGSSFRPHTLQPDGGSILRIQNDRAGVQIFFDEEGKLTDVCPFS